MPGCPSSRWRPTATRCASTSARASRRRSSCCGTPDVGREPAAALTADEAVGRRVGLRAGAVGEAIAPQQLVADQQERDALLALHGAARAHLLLARVQDPAR